MEGRNRHVAGLRFLRRDVQLLGTGTEVEDGVLAAAHTLGHIGVGLPFGPAIAVRMTTDWKVWQIYNTAGEAAEGWQDHMDGIYHLFRKRGPNKVHTPFVQALLHNTRQPAVMDGLLRRRPCVFSEVSWITAADATPSFGVRLANRAIQIPILLQRADQLCGDASPREEDIISLLAELAAFENDIQELLVRFYTLTSYEHVPYTYRTRSINCYTQFRELCGGLAHVFPTAIEFPSFISATSHMYVWLCLLVLRKTTLDVAELHPYPLIRPHGQKAALVAGVNECAINLCQSLAYLSRPEHFSLGILSCSGPLYFAAEWFRAQSAVQKLAWTQHVRRSLEGDSSLEGKGGTLHRLDPPLFLYWMLPNFIDAEAG